MSDYRNEPKPRNALLSDREWNILFETHKSTIEQETILKAVQEQLAQGELRFEDHGKRLLALENTSPGMNCLEHAERLQKLEAVEKSRQAAETEHERIEKLRRWWMRMAIVALSVPGAEWLWSHVVPALGGK